MSSTITTSIVTGGDNSHATTSAEANGVATDFIHAGVTGPITNTSGVAPNTGSFAVNAQGTPAMFVDVTAGNAWITATPSGQVSQKLRASMTANYTSYAISSNSSGSTKYDWIYLKVDPTAANNPASAADDVTALYTSRSSSNTTDNGTPPTYGVLLAVVTVANGASSITNSNISDKRTTATFRSSPATSGVNSVDVSTAATSGTPAITAQGSDTNISLNLVSKGTGSVQINGNSINAGAWTSWTPTWANLTIGNATVTGKYAQTGKKVTFTLSVTLGSTSSVSTSPTFTLPVTAAGTGTYPTDALGLQPIGNLIIHDASAAVFVGYTAINSTTTGLLLAYDASASILRGTTVSSTTPMSWTTTDKILATGTYEAA